MMRFLLGGLLGFCLASHALGQAPAPSFRNDVEPILTRLGCNQGSCHGKGAGQNGFRLSLRGYAPEWDHEWLTREFTARRVNPADPEASLLLRKPSGRTPHEGGVLMRPGSRAYQVLLDWVRAGAPGLVKDEPTVRRVFVEPESRVLKSGQRQPLTVRAEFTDGTTRDVTWLTQFASNDAAVAEVTPDGLVTVRRPGATSIRASYQGLVAVALLTAPFEQPVKAQWYARTNNVIDEHVFRKLHELHIEPSELCGDEVFLRRVFLDTLGVLPTPAEVRTFLADRSADKRAKLIDRVLDRPEFVDFWTLRLADLLQNRKESDHDVRGSKGVRRFHEWLRRQVAINRPWDELARDVLTVRGDTDRAPAIGWYVVTVGESREPHTSSVVASAAQTFLGTRIGCAQCHNHPLEKYTQDDYYHFAGFFSRVRLERKEPKQGPTKLTVSTADPNQNKQPVGVVQPRTHKFLPPRPLDRSPVTIDPGQDPRDALAAWITNPANESFAGAMVNRLWAHFFNVGLVEPVDDLRASNPPSNPALWQALVKEFIAKKYDRKHVMRLILNSRAYQLSATTRPSNANDHRFASHYEARRLPAEVLLDAICQATDVPERFDGYPLGLRAVQMPDPAVKPYFLATFGKSERLTACVCERQAEVTLSHTLHLLNNDGSLRRVRDGQGRLAALLRAKKTDRAIVDELFLVSLGRLPKPSEWSALARHLAGARPGTEFTREVALQEVFWALLNTKEFAFNH